MNKYKITGFVIDRMIGGMTDLPIAKVIDIIIEKIKNIKIESRRGEILILNITNTENRVILLETVNNIHNKILIEIEEFLNTETIDVTRIKMVGASINIRIE